MVRRGVGRGRCPGGQVCIVTLNGKPSEACWDVCLERTLWLFVAAEAGRGPLQSSWRQVMGTWGHWSGRKSSEVGEKCLGSGYILEMELPGLLRVCVRPGGEESRATPGGLAGDPEEGAGSP